MKALNMRAARTLAGAGVYAYDAEMKVAMEDGAVVFLHANYAEENHFTVARESIFDYMVGESADEPAIEVLEEYDSLLAAMVSPYYRGFQALDALVDEYIEWRTQSGDDWLLEKALPEIDMDRAAVKQLAEYNIVNERVGDYSSEGQACGPVSIYVVEAEIETIEDGVHYFYQGEWVDAAGDEVLLCKRRKSVFARQLAADIDLDSIDDTDIIEHFNHIDEAIDARDIAIYSKLKSMIAAVVDLD